MLRYVAVETIANRYEVVRRLGAGSMGDVWLAKDLLLGRDVAMKFVGERELRETPGAANILRDEARTAGSLLGHPQIVGVLDLLDVSTPLHTGPAIVLEYVNGCNLAEWIAIHAPRLSEETRTRVGLYIALEVVEAIHTAHKLGILHRDIKPQNILCSATGRVKVADFGLARVVEAMTRTHTMWGRHTPLYAAPEQWEDRKPDENTDIYQLCATLYHLLAGRPANEGQNLIGLMRWQQTGTLQPLDDVVGLPQTVGQLIQDGLSNEPDKRPSLWKIFDAISDASMPQVKMAIDVQGCDEATILQIAELTDYNEEKLLAKTMPSGGGTTFPNALEALREAMGVTLLGGLPVISLARSAS